MYLLSDELGDWMNKYCTVVRLNSQLEETYAKVDELRDRYENIGVDDSGLYANQALAFARQLWDMLELARPMVKGAILRDESRGAHYKPDFPERDDEKFLKTTISEYSLDGPKISYEEVDVTEIKPRLRSYETASEGVKGSKVAG
jgi:succinate dehydrogenase / fumarate reductase flavoprotein subunit